MKRKLHLKLQESAGGPVIDRSEAPPGYFAVFKSDVASPSLRNICWACDWRPHCDGRYYRCMATPVVTPDGHELRRNDGCNVVFIRLPCAESTSDRTTDG